MSYLDLTFPWFEANIKNVVPKGEISLMQLINATISPKPKVRQAFLDIQKAADDGDLKLKDKLKQENLFFTTPSVKLKYRNYDSIEEFLPFAVFEYDKIPYAEELKQYIFEKFPSCILAFLSPSKTGCKFIFLIDVPTSVKHYKELYSYIAYDLDKFKGLDTSNLRCVLPLFNSWDANALYREDAVPSKGRGFITNSFSIPENIEVPKGNSSELEEARCMSLIANLIDRIEDEGHGQVVKAAFVCGGLSSFYGLPNLQSLLEDSIRSNEYLSKNTEGYLRTSRQMFSSGLEFPTPLKDK